MDAAKADVEEAQARMEIWKYMSGFTEVAVVKCVVELGIPDILENHAGADGDGVITLDQLSSALGCSASALYRIMRFLTHRGIFKEVKSTDEESSSIAYAQTAVSRLLMKTGMAPFLLLLTNPLMVASLHDLSKLVLTNGGSAFEVAHGKDLWQYAAVDPSLNNLFNDGMASNARVTALMVAENYPAAFEGIGSLVDVGGGNGMTLHALVKAFPWIRGINFDLPHVVSCAPHSDGIEHTGGNFFESVPHADAVFIMWVLHDWDDDACVKILKNCKEAIPKDTGKVIIVEAVVDEVEGNNSKYRDVHLALDMLMMTFTIKGKERTSKEWGHVISAAGFTKQTIKHIPAAPLSVIEAFP